MLSASDQLQQIEAHLLATGGLPVFHRATISVLPGDVEGFLDLTLAYPTGYLLRVAIAIDTRHGFPNWTRYGFHLHTAEGSTVWRYDNSPYHPEVATYPDHKHVGPEETVEPHLRPSLRLISDELLRVAAEPKD